MAISERNHMRLDQARAWQSTPKPDEAAKPLSQRLMEQADAEDRRADQFRGCSFMGEWPGSSHLRQASLLREAAYAALVSERAAAKPTKPKRKK